MIIQKGIGEFELAGGYFISTYMFKIDDAGTTFCSTSFLDKSFRWNSSATRRMPLPWPMQTVASRLRSIPLSEPIAHLPEKQAKTLVYRRSLLTLRSINDIEEQRAFDLPQPFCCTSDYALKGGSPLSTLENNAFSNVADPQLIKTQ